MVAHSKSFVAPVLHRRRRATASKPVAQTVKQPLLGRRCPSSGGGEAGADGEASASSHELPPEEPLPALQRPGDGEPGREEAAESADNSFRGRARTGLGRMKPLLNLKDLCQTTRVGTARLPYTLLHALMLPLEPHVWFTAVCKLRASKTGVERSSLSHFPPGHPPRKTSVHSLSTLRIPKAREVLTPPFQLQGAHQKTQTPCCPLKK